MILYSCFRWFRRAYQALPYRNSSSTIAASISCVVSLPVDLPFSSNAFTEFSFRPLPRQWCGLCCCPYFPHTSMYFLFKQLHKVLIGHFRRFHIDMSVLSFLRTFIQSSHSLTELEISVETVSIRAITLISSGVNSDEKKDNPTGLPSLIRSDIAEKTRRLKIGNKKLRSQFAFKLSVKLRVGHNDAMSISSAFAARRAFVRCVLTLFILSP